MDRDTTLPFSYQPEDPVGAITAFNDGIRTMQEGKKEDAANLWNTALKLDPALLPAALNLVTYYMESEQYELELKAWENVISYDPFNADYLIRQAAAYVRCGIYDKAIDCYERAISIYPYYKFWYFELSRLHDSQGHDDEAMRWKSEGEALNTDIAEMCYQDGLNHLQDSSWESAKSCFEAVLEELPENLEARIKLAETLSTIGELDAAQAQFQQALEISTYAKPLVYYRQAQFFVSSNAIDEAIACLQKALTVERPYYRAAKALQAHTLKAETHTSPEIETPPSASIEPQQPEAEQQAEETDASLDPLGNTSEQVVASEPEKQPLPSVIIDGLITEELEKDSEPPVDQQEKPEELEAAGRVEETDTLLDPLGNTAEQEVASEPEKQPLPSVIIDGLLTEELEKDSEPPVTQPETPQEPETGLREEEADALLDTLENTAEREPVNETEEEPLPSVVIDSHLSEELEKESTPAVTESPVQQDDPETALQEEEADALLDTLENTAEREPVNETEEEPLPSVIIDSHLSEELEKESTPAVTESPVQQDEPETVSSSETDFEDSHAGEQPATRPSLHRDDSIPELPIPDIELPWIEQLKHRLDQVCALPCPLTGGPPKVGLLVEPDRELAGVYERLLSDILSRNTLKQGSKTPQVLIIQSERIRDDGRKEPFRGGWWGVNPESSFPPLRWQINKANLPLVDALEKVDYFSSKVGLNCLLVLTFGRCSGDKEKILKHLQDLPLYSLCLIQPSYHYIDVAIALEQGSPNFLKVTV